MLSDQVRLLFLKNVAKIQLDDRDVFEVIFNMGEVATVLDGRFRRFKPEFSCSW